jgi:hypothetical protein
MSATFQNPFVRWSVPRSARDKDTLRILRLWPCVIVHLGGPLQEVTDLFALPEHESPELEKADLVHFEAGKSFHAPTQVGAAPRSKAVSAGCVPEEPEELTHVVTSINKCWCCRLKRKSIRRRQGGTLTVSHRSRDITVGSSQRRCIHPAGHHATQFPWASQGSVVNSLKVA